MDVVVRKMIRNLIKPYIALMKDPLMFSQEIPKPQGEQCSWT